MKQPLASRLPALGEVTKPLNRRTEFKPLSQRFLLAHTGQTRRRSVPQPTASEGGRGETLPPAGRPEVVAAARAGVGRALVRWCVVSAG